MILFNKTTSLLFVLALLVFSFTVGCAKKPTAYVGGNIAVYNSQSVVNRTLLTNLQSLETVSIVEQKESWTKIQFAGKRTGWVDSAYIFQTPAVLLKDGHPYHSSTDLNGNLTGEPTGTLDYGTIFFIIEEKPDISFKIRLLDNPTPYWIKTSPAVSIGSEIVSAAITMKLADRALAEGDIEKAKALYLEAEKLPTVFQADIQDKLRAIDMPPTPTTNTVSVEPESGAP
jgi:hypothetical protein